MPLYKRKPFPLVVPPQDLDPHNLVFQIRFTKEIFQDYQEYLNRLNLYRQRVWACKVTGKTNLTYEEALVAERRATEKVQQFPKELMAPVLHMIQYSKLSLKDLANAIYSKLHERLFEGMELHGRKEQSICACKILEVLEDGDTTQYKVGWIDSDKKLTETSITNIEDLIRQKPPLSRNVLKAFIRDSTSRSAPWVVHEKLAKKHRILTEPPWVVHEKLAKKHRVLTEPPPEENAENLKINKKRKTTENKNSASMGAIKKKTKKEEDKPKEEPIIYPIDDLLVKPAADDPIFTDRPSLSTDFSVPMDCVGDLLMVWNFCSSFGRLLNLWHFSLEDFENAICHKDSDLILIAELHSAIFRFLIKDEGSYFMAIRNKKGHSKVTLTNWAKYLCNFLEMEDRPELSSHVTAIKCGHYGLLDTRLKLDILWELVAEALTTDAIRDKLDECIKQQQELAATKRGEARKKRDGQHREEEKSDSKEMYQANIMENGKRNLHNSSVDGMPAQHEDVPEDETERNHISDNREKRCNVANPKEAAKNPRMGNESYVENILPGVKKSMKMQRGGKDKDKETLDKKPEERKEHLEREIEKLSIRTSSLGNDRDHNRYWFFRREGRLFVESSDCKQWGYYTAKEELDALMGSLNPKGERERELQKQLEKYYHRISGALQKRSRDISQKFLLEEAELRRSTRVRSQPRDSPAVAFLRYVNKWKEN